MSARRTADARGASVSMVHQMMSALPQLRYLPMHRQLRARVGDTVVADTKRPMLIWEPTRVVPSYAVPEADISATLHPAAVGPVHEYRPVSLGTEFPEVLDPRVPFTVHTAKGEPLTVHTAAGSGEGAAFRLADPGLRGYVALDFEAFDWWEEDEQIVGHPRDPFHRIDVRRSSRTVRLEHHGEVLAESNRPRMLFEGAFLVTRYYLPRADVRVELRPGTLQTTCAYKGHATHYSAVIAERELRDIAWSYADPFHDATKVKGLICFYQEHLDLFLDGEPVRRPITPWT
jgi:uncharacterized protein (DUF427 family)